MSDLSQLQAGVQALIPLGFINPGRNPRKYFDPDEMEELGASIKAQGVIQPIVVRPVGDDRFEIVAGERRHRAATAVHGEEWRIPCVVRELTDDQVDRIALIENIQRADMSPAEEAIAAAKVVGYCDGDKEEAGRQLGWSRFKLDRRLSLVQCAGVVLDALAERKISLGHAELLAACAKDVQEKILAEILGATAIPSVADLKRQLEVLAKPLQGACFDTADCAACPHNSGQQRVMFAEAISAEASCTNSACYDAKVQAAIDAQVEGMKDEYPCVKIVRPGDNFSLVKLDPAFIGEAQAQACAGCKDYGAAVSAVPGKEGKVFKNLCFMPSCFKDKSVAFAKAKKAAEEVAKEPEVGQQGKQAGEVVGKPAKKAAAKKEPEATEIHATTAVKEYRVGMWRRVLKAELQAAGQADRNLTVLLAMCMTHNGRHIDGSKLVDVFNRLAGSSTSTTDISGVILALQTATPEVRQKMLSGLAATAVTGIEEGTLVRILQTLSIDLTQHWSVGEDFLKLLTKSEIKVFCAEIGLKEAMGKDFAKAFLGKKEDLIKAVLHVEGFDYQGKAPAVLLF